MKSVKTYVAIAMVALLIIGGAYAGWHEQLSFAGTVNTGNIDVQFIDAVVCYEQDKDIADVGDVEIALNGKSMEITIDNAYPQLEGTIYFLVENKGTVPVHLETKILDYDSSALYVENHGLPPGCYYSWQYIGTYPWGYWGWVLVCPEPPEECPPAAWLDHQGLGEGTQLGEDHAIAMGSIYFKVLNDAEQNSTYSFTVDYEYINWNESEH